MIKFASKVILLLVVMTATMVVYVYGQTKIFQVSYEINRKTEIREDKGEFYRQIRFEVDQLKAPQVLERQMHDMKLDLTLPREVRVIALPLLPSVGDTVAGLSIKEGPVMPNSYFSFLGQWVKVAQAKMDR